MKRIFSTLSILMVLAISSATNHAWSLDGRLRCADGTSFANVTITVTGNSVCSGAFNQSVNTDSEGYFTMSLPDCAGSFTACLDTSDLPPGVTLVGPACVPFTTTDVDRFILIGWTANCGPVPPPA